MCIAVRVAFKGSNHTEFLFTTRFQVLKVSQQRAHAQNTVSKYL